MAAQSSSSKGFIKKNWAEDETRLLRWAVVTYTRQKAINYNNLVSVLLLTHSFVGNVRLAEHSEAGPWTE
jgi:hypothetical protein